VSVGCLTLCESPHPSLEAVSHSKFRTYLGTGSVHRGFPGRRRTVVLLNGVQPRFNPPVVAGVPFVRQPATVGHRWLLLATTTVANGRRPSIVAQYRGPRGRWTGGRGGRQDVQHHSTAYPKLTLSTVRQKPRLLVSKMITIRRTITNSTPGLKAASCGKHPGRRRIHRGERIKEIRSENDDYSRD